mmetsp:Transcript_49150/g.117086  ORF Transcript_49150/g.117086 Transcript_49150/m.117086 type:complete len:257 (+) Transcript_49150:62-832(+)
MDVCKKTLVASLPTLLLSLGFRQIRQLSRFVQWMVNPQKPLQEEALHGLRLHNDELWLESALVHHQHPYHCGQLSAAADVHEDLGKAVWTHRLLQANDLLRLESVANLKCDVRVVYTSLFHQHRLLIKADHTLRLCGDHLGGGTHMAANFKDHILGVHQLQSSSPVLTHFLANHQLRSPRQGQHVLLVPGADPMSAHFNRGALRWDEHPALAKSISHSLSDLRCRPPSSQEVSCEGRGQGQQCCSSGEPQALKVAS